MSSFQRHVSPEYAYCFCIRCRGSLRTRRTVQEHIVNVQKPLGKDDRICHCSYHPLGAIVNRRTAKHHQRNDRELENRAELSLETAGIGELVLDTLDPNAALSEISTIRNAILTTQSLFETDDSERPGEEVDDDDIDFDDEEVEGGIALEILDEPFPQGKVLLLSLHSTLLN